MDMLEKVTRAIYESHVGSAIPDGLWPNTYRLPAMRPTVESARAAIGAVAESLSVCGAEIRHPGGPGARDWQTGADDYRQMVRSIFEKALGVKFEAIQ